MVMLQSLKEVFKVVYDKMIWTIILRVKLHSYSVLYK